MRIQVESEEYKHARGSLGHRDDLRVLVMDSAKLRMQFVVRFNKRQ